jgi:hypothetical protein
MFTDKVQCNKCGLYIITQNKLIHDAQCKPIMNNQQTVLPKSNQNNKNIFFNDNLNNNINQLTNANINNIDEEFWYCTICQNYLDKAEKQDHILSHRFQDEDMIDEDLEERTPDEIDRNNLYLERNTSNGSNFVENRNYNNSNQNLNVCDTSKTNPFDSNCISNSRSNPFTNNINTNSNSSTNIRNVNRNTNPFMNSGTPSKIRIFIFTSSN